MTSSATASNRFGLGAKPGEITQQDGRARLLQQLQPSRQAGQAFASLPPSSVYLQRERAFQMARRLQKTAGGADAPASPDANADANTNAMAPQRRRRWRWPDAQPERCVRRTQRRCRRIS